MSRIWRRVSSSPPKSDSDGREASGAGSSGDGILRSGLATSSLASSRSKFVTVPEGVSIPSSTERWSWTRSRVLQTRWATSPASGLSRRTTLEPSPDETALSAM